MIETVLVVSLIKITMGHGDRTESLSFLEILIRKKPIKIREKNHKDSLMRRIPLLMFVCTNVAVEVAFTYLTYSCYPRVHTLPAVIVLKRHFSKEYIDEIFYFIRGYKVWI